MAKGLYNKTEKRDFSYGFHLGAPPLGAEDIDYLKKISVPRRHVRSEVIEDGTLNVSAALDSLEVRSIEVRIS